MLIFGLQSIFTETIILLYSFDRQEIEYLDFVFMIVTNSLSVNVFI